MDTFNLRGFLRGLTLRPRRRREQQRDDNADPAPPPPPPLQGTEPQSQLALQAQTQPEQQQPEPGPTPDQAPESHSPELESGPSQPAPSTAPVPLNGLVMRNNAAQSRSEWGRRQLDIHYNSDVHSPPTTQSFRLRSRPPVKPNRIFTALPPELHLSIFEHVDVFTLVQVRSTCRTWRAMVGRTLLERETTRMNEEGWPIGFTFKETLYQAVTYGNRRLCGGCLVPRSLGGLVREAEVVKYLGARAVREGWGCEEGEGLDIEDGLCFLCLWGLVIWGEEKKKMRGEDGKKNEKAGEEEEGEGKKQKLWEMANIDPKIEFIMMDGSRRKMCPDCKKDMHANAVPCPNCVDFAQWLRNRKGLAGPQEEFYVGVTR